MARLCFGFFTRLPTGFTSELQSNSIRAVVESNLKFCRPSLQEFASFMQFLINEHKIEVKGNLLNDLCHGGKFGGPLHYQDDIRVTAKEAVEIVSTFTIGQLETL